MTEKMVQITVEILDILAISTKKLKQSRASEFNPCLTLLAANIGSEKFLKKVAGRTDLEDGLKKLEKLTNEEVAMASARLLKIMDNIDNEVTGVGDGVRGVDEKVQVVGGEVQVVKSQVQVVKGEVHAVKGEVQLVNDNVNVVGDKVQTMAEGTQSLFINSLASSAAFFHHIDGKATATEVKLVLQQAADDVDKVKRSYSVPSSLAAEYLT